MRFLRTIVLISLLCLLLGACTRTELVPVPEIVEVPTYIDHPLDLTKPCPPTEIPDVVSYADIIGYHLLDRECVKDLNRRMEVIRGE